VLLQTIFTSLIFFAVAGGLGWPLVARLALAPAEKF